MPYELIPMSQKQFVNIKYLESLKAVEEWLDGFAEVRAAINGTPLSYQHLDHVQILPPNEHGYYPVLTIHRTVYLQKGI
jgi:hypothetical protein